MVGSMTSSGVSDLPIRGFISYTRRDNLDFGGVVDELRQVLAALFEARTGQRLELFIDRESIGWGEDWRARIEDSIRAATFFIPIITMRYFSSQACVDELTAFEATARKLGVTDLILPIVLFGAEEISEEDDRPEVQLIARLNYRSLEVAWEAGYQSPQWREFVNARAKELVRALSAAETALDTTVAVEVPNLMTLSGPFQPEPAVDAGTLEVGLTDWVGQLGTATEDLNRATDALTSLSTVASQVNTSNLGKLSPAQQNARLAAIAHDLTEPARRVELTGLKAERSIREVDPQLRAWLADLASIDLPEAQTQLKDLLQAIRDGGNMYEVEGQVSELTQTIQLVSLTSVGLRKALKPAVNGLRSLLTAVRIYEGWQLIDPSKA